MLLVRHLAEASSLAPRTVWETLLEEDGPTRLTALAAPSGVSQPAMTQLVGRLRRRPECLRLRRPRRCACHAGRYHRRRAGIRAELHEAQNDHLAELLETLSPEDEATLGLAMRILPLMQRLTQQAALTNGASRR